MNVEMGRPQKDAQCVGAKTVCPSSLKSMARLQAGGWGGVRNRSRLKQQESETT